MGYWTDRIGRKTMFIVDLLVFLVAAVLMLGVTQLWHVVSLGVLLGVAVGGDYAIGSPLLGEYTRAQDRGHHLGLLELLWNVGYVLSFLIGFVLLRAHPELWRVELATAAVPAIVILCLRHGLPESPRWLVAQGRVDEATASLAAVGATIHDEDYREDGSVPTAFRSLFVRDYLARTVFVSVFWMCIVVPYFALAFFQSEVLGVIGLEDPISAALLGTLVALVGAATGWLLVDRVGRRPLLVIPMFATAVFLAVVALSGTLHLPVAVTVVCFFGYLLFYGVMSILPGVYPLEVFPTAIRTTGMGFASAMSRVGAAIGTFLLPVALGAFGLSWTLAVLVVVCLVGGVVSLRLAPETARRSLTETGSIAGVGPHLVRREGNHR
ncbi:MFS transporter [Curtobacterium sp. MCBA15_001]|uniref:MFS transporter n=1 Tax=Curtobacterium sp. MCBA15_001 TaxID=1898731 RepID=UPI0026745CBA|nr:MFS transporter [Curtobacterium sp. MCBA15_001]